MIWLKIISKFIKALRAGDSPAQVAGGFSFGFLIGLLPFWNLIGISLLLILLFLNINLAAGTVALLLGGLFAYLLDPVFHSVGYFFLADVSALDGMWTALYNMPVAPLSRFNNTVVMGSFVVGIVAVFPVFFGMKKLVVAYRSGFEERVKKWKIVQAIRGSSLYRFYVKISDLGGD